MSPVERGTRGVGAPGLRQRPGATGPDVLARAEGCAGRDVHTEGAVREDAGRGAERVAERVADEREGARPHERPEQAPRQERPQAHPRRAGQERRDRADEADEAPDEDRLRAVMVEERLDALQPRRRDADPRAAGDDEAPAEALAEREAREVAPGGGDPGD